MWTPDPNIVRSALALVEGEKNLTANLANISALLFYSLKDLNWAGFYLWSEEDKELVLGPFQGKPACLRIKPNRGVCGAAYREQSTQRVPDVHAFPGHIACDGDTRSELVVPLMHQGQCVGVLDLDSPRLDRFTSEDQLLVEELVTTFMPIIWRTK
ncbi:MAG: GAF domain-containing protein [Proteobacteria bacterium]|jgi:GAF domain-containing protein|nr:GAF domain-containing protein [Pseudomonadota bacterium]